MDPKLHESTPRSRGYRRRRSVLIDPVNPSLYLLSGEAGSRKRLITLPHPSYRILPVPRNARVFGDATGGNDEENTRVHNFIHVHLLRQESACSWYIHQAMEQHWMVRYHFAFPEGSLQLTLRKSPTDCELSGSQITRVPTRSSPFSSPISHTPLAVQDDRQSGEGHIFGSSLHSSQPRTLLLVQNPVPGASRDPPQG